MTSFSFFFFVCIFFLVALNGRVANNQIHNCVTVVIAESVRVHLVCPPPSSSVKLFYVKDIATSQLGDVIYRIDNLNRPCRNAMTNAIESFFSFPISVLFFPCQICARSLAMALSLLYTHFRVYKIPNKKNDCHSRRTTSVFTWVQKVF